jgi:hypothetical protein
MVKAEVRDAKVSGEPSLVEKGRCGAGEAGDDRKRQRYGQERSIA